MAKTLKLGSFVVLSKKSRRFLCPQSVSPTCWTKHVEDAESYSSKEAAKNGAALILKKAHDLANEALDESARQPFVMPKVRVRELRVKK